MSFNFIFKKNRKYISLTCDASNCSFTFADNGIIDSFMKVHTVEVEKNLLPHIFFTAEVFCRDESTGATSYYRRFSPCK